MKRQAGVLLPIFSLPSNHGIGDFGNTAYEFVDIIAEMGNKIWQILPLNKLGYGESPYQALSSFAGEELFINLDFLKQQGLIKSQILTLPPTTKINYETVRKFKEPYLLEAFKNFIPTDDYKIFIKQEWVETYSVFITFKKVNGGQCWNKWEESFRDWIENRNLDLTVYEQDINYQLFLQYIFYTQWQNLKKYANSKNIEIIGDLPIYTGLDSQDVWCNQDVYRLDENYEAEYVAGVGPDYFSETGQRWGNPLYDWQYLEKTHFDFWIKRLSYTEKMYDHIRIDHFRAFDTYWEIPASCPTAIDGQWQEAPGYQLFDEIQKQLPNIKIIAEDLGELRKEVIELRDHYNLKGMKVVQLMIDYDKESNLNESSNLVIYTGTHDNQTLQGWINSLDDQKISTIKAFFEAKNYNNEALYQNFNEYTYHTLPNIAIIPVQDLLGLDDEARINKPGELSSDNWSWKLVDFQQLYTLIPTIKQWLKASKRI